MDLVSTVYLDTEKKKSIYISAQGLLNLESCSNKNQILFDKGEEFL